MQEESTWISLREFAELYGRTRAWAYMSAVSGSLIDFGISTLQIARTNSGKRNSRRWYFYVPDSLLQSGQHIKPTR